MTARLTAFGNLYNQVQGLINPLIVQFDSDALGGETALIALLADEAVLSNTLFIWDPSTAATGAAIDVDLSAETPLAVYTTIHYHNRSDRAGTIAGVTVNLTLPGGSAGTGGQFAILPGEMVSLFRVLDGASASRYVNVPGFITPVNVADSSATVTTYAA
jgi:hypothetical protein